MGGQSGMTASGLEDSDAPVQKAGIAATTRIEIITAEPAVPLRDEILCHVAESLGSRPSERPLHYLVVDDSMTMSSDSSVTLDAPLGDGSARSSWSVQLGRPLHSTVPASARDFALVSIPSIGPAATLVDLLAAKCTVIVGVAEEKDRLVRSIARELVSAGQPPNVVGVGSIGPDYVRRLDNLASACNAVATSTSPIVVLVGGELVDHDGFERLVAAVRRHESAAIVAGAPHAEARLVLIAGNHGRCTVFLRQSVACGPRHESPHHRDANSRIGVDVSVLGPIEIRGSAEPLGGHPLLTELVVYLAMHPEGATTAAWETALWPERRMPPQTIANRLSEARRALGVAADGRARLRRSDERHLIAEITTDWDRFQTFAADDNPASWRRALELVRGRPFSDLHQAQWVALEGFAIEIEHAIVDCALRLGRDALGRGEPDEAISAAQRALRATPWDERLHRLLMVASDAAGDRAGVEATLRHLALVLEIDGDPLGRVHPETARLYNRLSGRCEVVSASV